jgi:hypothetical protein
MPAVSVGQVSGKHGLEPRHGYFPNLAAIDRPGRFRFDRRAREGFPVSLTILYRNPRRPDEAGMTVVADQAKAAAVKDQLEDRGYLVIKIVTATFAKPAPAI